MPTIATPTNLQQHCAVALIGQNCSICKHSLAKPRDNGTHFPITQLHAVTRHDRRGKLTGERLSPILEECARAPAALDGHRHKHTHLFHTECLVEYAAKQLAITGTGSDNRPGFPCATCNKRVELSAIKPFYTPALRPSDVDIQNFRTTVAATIYDTAKAMIARDSVSEKSPLLANAKRIRRSAPSGVLSAHINRPLISLGQDDASTASSPTEPLSPEQLKMIGATLLITSFASGLIHAPMGIVLLTATLGSGYLTTGALENCNDGNNRTTTQTHDPSGASFK